MNNPNHVLCHNIMRTLQSKWVNCNLHEFHANQQTNHASSYAFKSHQAVHRQLSHTNSIDPALIPLQLITHPGTTCCCVTCLAPEVMDVSMSHNSPIFIISFCLHPCFCLRNTDLFVNLSMFASGTPGYKHQGQLCHGQLLTNSWQIVWWKLWCALGYLIDYLVVMWASLHTTECISPGTWVLKASYHFLQRKLSSFASFSLMCVFFKCHHLFFHLRCWEPTCRAYAPTSEYKWNTWYVCFVWIYIAQQTIVMGMTSYVLFLSYDMCLDLIYRV